MFRMLIARGRILLIGGLALAALIPLDGAQAKKGFRVLYTFQGGSAGGTPSTGLVMDGAGNLYGGDGNIYKLTPDGTFTVLYAFKGGTQDGNAANGLMIDAAGNLYGTTELGGSSCKHVGCGTVFRIAPDGSETILHAFERGADGIYPRADLLMDAAGNLYGTTYNGGGVRCRDRLGCGTVFKLAPDGTETIVHAFKGGHDGAYPGGGLIADTAGNLYGTTEQGGRRCLRQRRFWLRCSVQACTRWY